MARQILLGVEIVAIIIIGTIVFVFYATKRRTMEQRFRSGTSKTVGDIVFVINGQKVLGEEFLTRQDSRILSSQ